MKELHYKMYEDLKLFEPSDEEYELHFNQVPANKRSDFAYVKGTVLSRKVNKRHVRFTEKALTQAEAEFKPTPFLTDHVRSFDSMKGTITNLKLDDNGLNYYSIIPRTPNNEHTITMLQNDVAGLIKTSIGGKTTSITCNLCDEELFNDRQHKFGEKYDGVKAYGNVNTWNTKEISLTLFPADDDASTQVYTTGFSELDEFLVKGSDILLNEEVNKESELNMTTGGKDVGKEGTPDPAKEIEIAQADSPSLDNFAKKEDLDLVLSQLKIITDGLAKQEADKLDAKRLELSELTKEKVEKYSDLNLSALDQMIDLAKLVKGADVPEERGQVELSNLKPAKVSDDMKKEAIRVILGIGQTSEKVAKFYGDYTQGYQDDIYDRVNKSLEVTFAEPDEGDK